MLFAEVSVSWAVTILFSSTLLLYLSAYALQRKQVHGAVEFAFFMLSVSFYSLAYALEMNATTESRIIDVLKFEVFWASFTAPAFFLFAVRFIRRKESSVLRTLPLFIIPLIIGCFAFTNDRHTFIYKSYTVVQGAYFPIIHYEPGIVYIFQLAFLIATSLFAEVLLLIHFLKSNNTIRKQTILILIAGLLPTVSAAVNPGRSTFNGLDTQPFAFLISGILLALALFHFKMFNLVRIAREYAVDTIHDYLIIIDKDLVVRDINASGRNSALLNSFETGCLLPGECDFASDLIQHIRANSFQADTVFQYEQNKRHYKYSLAPIQSNAEHIEGYVVLINENTEHVRLMKNLESLAFKDGLTGIYNRRYFTELSNREIEMARRGRNSLSMIMFDLDDFKKINDSYGHPVGDRVLVRVARAVQKELRASELFGRYGGEEFCILCPETSVEESSLVADRLRKVINSLLWFENGTSFTLTASFGVYSTSDLENMDIKSLFTKADQNLYRAKHEGKNCVRSETENKIPSSQMT
ncbi:MAG: diguanylate cyclase [Spirochaetales bacterium]|nr:diguanylate cyclase [Spirochaetales bacterium]